MGVFGIPDQIRGMSAAIRGSQARFKPTASGATVGTVERPSAAKILRNSTKFELTA